MRDSRDEALPVWKRERSATAEHVVEDRPLRCGGPSYTRAEVLALRRAERMRRRAEEAAARREPEPEPVEPPKDDDEDEDKAAERRRNDRYAVKLLRQDDSAWGGSGADSGMLG
jgi:hypothetical protein